MNCVVSEMIHTHTHAGAPHNASVSQSFDGKIKTGKKINGLLFCTVAMAIFPPLH